MNTWPVEWLGELSPAGGVLAEEDGRNSGGHRM